jgi:ferredoxin
MSYRIIIDGSICNGYGACADVDPSDFQIGDGIARAPVVAIDGVAARQAARQCPMGAISVLDEAGAEVR